jgi:hypothetical protein
MVLLEVFTVSIVQLIQEEEKPNGLNVKRLALFIIQSESNLYLGAHKVCSINRHTCKGIPKVLEESMTQGYGCLMFAFGSDVESSLRRYFGQQTNR